MGTEAKGHPTGFWFFFWGELAERCSYYGMRAILALYMIERLGVDKGDAGTFMALFIAACYFFPLVGGLIADNLLGKYWTIVLFAVPYVVAQCLVGIENKYLVVGTLALLAMGSGVIKPNISTLMGMTYDQQRPGQDQLRTSAFSWFYLAINVGATASQIAMPWLRNQYGYQVAFVFPAVLMSIALVVFALGKRYYARESITRKVVLQPGESAPADGRTVTGLPIHYQVMTADEKAADSRLKWETLGKIGALFLTIMFFWAIFDQSASTWIFFADTYMNCTLFGVEARADAIQAFNGTFIILLVPLSVILWKRFPLKPTTKIGLGYAFTGLSMVIMSLAGFLAGEAQKAVKVTFPEGSLVVPNWTSTEFDTFASPPPGVIAAGDGVRFASDTWKYNADSKKLTFTDGHFNLPGGQRVEVKGGHLVNLPTAADLTAGGVLEPLLKSGDALAQVKPDATAATLERIDWVPPAQRVTVWWQVLAYLILTVAEILVSITGLELAFVAAPASMKSFVTACFLSVVFLANLLIVAPIAQLYPKMAPGVYFAVLAGMMVVVIAIYIPIAMRFNRMMAANKATGVSQ